MGSYWEPWTDFGQHSNKAQHAWITPTEYIPRGPAQRTLVLSATPGKGKMASTESVIWTLQNHPAGDGPSLLVPSWVNIDGTVTPNLSLATVSPFKALAMTDNVARFSKGRDDVHAVEFVFLPQDSPSISL
ncbi:hypothetical protein C8Q70DRAFT_937909 [Cubamyces menziesii]|nr:hypothetical protein C8Q70DRAFT_937909 [Cubamyces menziesii]